MQGRSSSQFKIPRRSLRCFHGNEPLEPGVEYYSLLLEGDEPGVYSRQDLCHACWQRMSKEKINDSKAYWKAIVPKKVQPSELPKQRDIRAWHLFKEALDKEDPQTLIETFVLSLYLARKKKLIFRKAITLENLQPAFLYEAADTEEIFCIRQFTLAEEKIAQVQADLAQKFGS